MQMPRKNLVISAFACGSKFETNAAFTTIAMIAKV